MGCCGPTWNKRERGSVMRKQEQDNRVCMFYITERLQDILDVKDGKKAHKKVHELYQEMVFNLGINSLHNNN